MASARERFGARLRLPPPRRRCGPGFRARSFQRRSRELPARYGVYLLLVLAGAGCTHQHFRPQGLNPGHEAAGPAAALFDFDPSQSPPPSESLLAEEEEFTLHRVHFPERPGSLFPADGVTAVEYRPKERSPRNRAGIVLLPIQGGDYEVATYFADYFASRGYACLRFERRAEWLLPDRDTGLLNPLIREYVVDVRRGLGWWGESGRVDPGRIGLFGVSMGAIIGSLVTALEGPRLQTSVLVLGGGSLADILMTADDREIDRVRRAWVEKAGGDEAYLSSQLHRTLDPVDPLSLAPLLRPDRALMIQGRFDRVVRFPLGTAIWEAAGKPERIVLPTGHYSSALLIRYIRWKALRWFDRRLVPQHEKRS